MGWPDGWPWLAGMRTRLEWQEVGVGVGVGTGIAMQHSIISSTPCRAASAGSTTLRHGTNRGERQNRDKEKEDLHTGLCYACTVGAWGWTTDYPILLEVQADD